MYHVQPSTRNTTGWIYDGSTQQLFYFEYATNQIVTQHGIRYQRPPNISIQSLEIAANSYLASQRSQIEPRNFPNPQAFNALRASPQSLPNTSYVVETNRQARSGSGASSNSPLSPIARFQRLSLNEQNLSQNWSNGTDPKIRQGHDTLPSPNQPKGQFYKSLGTDDLPPDASLLYEDFKKAKYPKKFFKFGKVFHTLWSEASDTASILSGSRAWTRNSFGEYIHSKVRRFVVVKEGKFSCTAVPVTTYSGKGVGKHNIKKSDHAIIFSGKAQPPTPLPDELPNFADGEDGMQPYAIRIDPDEKIMKLDPMSRVDFGRPATIQHNVKAKSFGMVNRDSMQHLKTQFRNVFLEDSSKSMKRPSIRHLPARTNMQSAISGAETPLKELIDRACRDLVKCGWLEDEVKTLLAPVRARNDESTEHASIEGFESDGEAGSEGGSDVDEIGSETDVVAVAVDR